MKTFGELLHLIRSRQNASQLVKEVGISYVYLLDIEKGARTAPKESILIERLLNEKKGCPEQGSQITTLQ